MHGQKQRIMGNICLFYFSRMKRYLRLSKTLQFCELRYPICIICIRRGTNSATEANVRTIIVLYNEPYKNFTRSCLHRKKKQVETQISELRYCELRYYNFTKIQIPL